MFLQRRQISACVDGHPGPPPSTRGAGPGSRHHAPAESGIAEFCSKCSNTVRRRPGRSAKMIRNHHGFRKFTRAVASRQPGGRQQSHHRRGRVRRMTKLDLPPWLKPHTIVCHAMAVVSVAVAIIAAELITLLLHAEAIASSMLCAVIFAAWFGGLGPALTAIALALLSFHYYLVPPINSFTWKHGLFALDASETPRLILFLVTSFLVAFIVSAQRKAAQALRRSRDDLQVAIKDQKRIEAALRHSEMYLTEAQRLSRTGSFGWNVG